MSVVATLTIPSGRESHAINRSVDDPNVVVVYLQARSIEQLRAFAESTSLADAMQRAGVTSPRELSFVQGGAWES